MPSETDSTNSGRVERIVTRWREWFLLKGNRNHVTGAIACLIFLFIASVTASGFAPLRSVQPLFYVFGGLISGNLTVITVVVSINQLLLSRELTTPGDLRSEIDGTVDYRKSVERTAGRVPPVVPRGFLRLLFENTRREAQQLGGLAVSETGGEVYEEVDRAVSEVTEHVDSVDSLLKESDASTFDALSVTLSTNYAEDIHNLRQIQSNHGDHLPAQVSDSIDSLVSDLQDVDIARQYFKSIYLQQELTSLSRGLLYVGLPSVALVAAGVLLFTAPNGVSISSSSLILLVPGIIAVGLLPLTMLFASILRIVTVTQRTVATTPFTTPEQEE